MPATQISFSSFALAALQVGTPRTPPVIDTAVAVVAHPLAVDGGECIPYSGVYEPSRSVSWFAIRDDFRCEDIQSDWGFVSMDAPAFLPLGGHQSFRSYYGDVKSDGFTGGR